MSDVAPFVISGKQCFYSFYEIEIPIKTITIYMLVIDGLPNSADIGPISEGVRASGIWSWQIAIKTYSDFDKDCPQEDSLSRKTILKYLRTVKR